MKNNPPIKLVSQHQPIPMKIGVLATAAGLASFGVLSLGPFAAEAVSVPKESAAVKATTAHRVVAYASRGNPKNRQKTCKRLNRIRNVTFKRPLRKTEKRFLKRKCGIKYPNIEGSKRNTKIYDNLFYNYGPKPIDTGYLTKPDGTVFFPDGMNIIVQNQYLNAFSENGALEGVLGVGMNPFYFSDPGRRPTGFRILQPQPGKLPQGKVIDTQILVSAWNESTEARRITIGLKTHDRSPEEIIASSSFVMSPGDSKTYIVMDSIDQPKSDYQITTEAYNPTTHDSFVTVQPESKEKSLKYRSLKTATLFFAVDYYSPEPRYYQRGVLVGAPTTNVEVPEFTRPSKQQRMNRGW